jgi:hypothetical protein
MFYHLLIAVIGIVSLVCIWVAIQALVRRQSPELRDESDVLACSICGSDGTCFCGLKNASTRQPPRKTID